MMDPEVGLVLVEPRRPAEKHSGYHSEPSPMLFSDDATGIVI